MQKEYAVKTSQNFMFSRGGYRSSLIAAALCGASAAFAALPAGYTQLTYIESSGTQYIDTGVVPQSNSRLVCDFQYTSLPASGGIAWNGWCAGGSRDALLFGISGGNFSASACSPGGGSIVYVSTGVPADVDRHTVDIQNSAMCFDGNSFATGTLGNTFTANDKMYLFARHIGWSSGGVDSHCSMRIYSCQIYAGDTLVRNYIPACRDSDGAVGLFDLKNGEFFGNAGTGSFTMEGVIDDDILHISSSRTGIGSPSPAYGETNGLAAGASFLVSCGATSLTNATESVQYSCTGWKLFDDEGTLRSSGTETSFTYVHPNPAEYRRLEWQWAESPVADAITRLDETAYAQDGLVVNFDALRNAGANAPRDPSATNWVDLVSGRTATLTRIAADPDQESDPGCWSKDAYRFAGHSYFLFDEAFNLGSSWTIQLACDVENPDSNADPMKGNYGIFGASYGMKLWKGASDLSAQYFLDVYKDNNNMKRNLIWGWNGKRATLMRENGNISMSFDSTRVAPAGVGLGTSATPEKRWMIGNHNGSLAGALVGRVHAVRIYSHALTQEEISQNWMVDNARFHGIATAKNMVVVASGLPGAEGTEADGAYLVAGSHTFTAPQSVTVGGNTYACTGYSLETFGSKTGYYTVWGGATESPDRSYTFTETWDGTPSVRLTWQWRLIDGVERYDASLYPQHGLVANFDGIRNAGATNAHDASAIVWRDVSGNGLHATNFVVDAALERGSWVDGNGYRFVTNDQFRTSALLELGPQFTWQIATTLAADVSNAKYYRPFSSGDGKTVFKGKPYSQQSYFYCRSQPRGEWNWQGKYVNAFRDNTASGWTMGTATPAFQTLPFDKNTTGVNRWIIGGNGTTAEAFKGIVHSVRVYDRMLTAAELKNTREIDDIRFRSSVPATNTVFVATSLEGAEGDQECGIYRVAGTGHTFTATERRRIGGSGYAATRCLVETWNATTKKWENPVSSTGSTWTTPAGGSWPSRRITWYWSIPGLTIIVR